jgi:hypothetical protein
MALSPILELLINLRLAIVRNGLLRGIFVVRTLIVIAIRILIMELRHSRRQLLMMMLLVLVVVLLEGMRSRVVLGILVLAHVISSTHNLAHLIAHHVSMPSHFTASSLRKLVGVLTLLKVLRRLLESVPIVRLRRQLLGVMLLVRHLVRVATLLLIFKLGI